MAKIEIAKTELVSTDPVTMCFASPPWLMSSPTSKLTLSKK